MFTGITQEVGTIQKIQKTGETLGVFVRSKVVPKDAKIGSSILIDGVCSTVTQKGNGWFAVQYVPETLRKTTVGDLKKGSKVNLEPSLKAGGEIAGHFVYGHVDGTGTVIERPARKNNMTLTIATTQNISRYFVDTGSVAVNGISLTVLSPKKTSFKVALIPHTLENTNLGVLKKGGKINIEIDVIAKYVEKFKK